MKKNLKAISLLKAEQLDNKVQSSLKAGAGHIDMTAQWVVGTNINTSAHIDLSAQWPQINNYF